jgi:hypothetical protein
MSLLLFASSSGRIEASVKAGDRLPEIVFSSVPEEKDCSYLGISAKFPLTLSDIPGRLFVIEVSNSYCLGCLKDIPAMKSIYHESLKDPRMKGKVKVVTVAAGNNKREVSGYIAENKIPYPVFPDPDFSLHRVFGTPRVPLLLVIEKTSKGNIVLWEQNSILHSPEPVLDIIRKQFSGDQRLPK